MDAAKAAGHPMTFAMTFPPGTHAMWMRYYLAAGGIHPGDAGGADADISLITIPPPQMVANMKVGQMDGFCVGEPWNQQAIAQGVGVPVITDYEIWKNNPEKVLGITQDFATKNPNTTVHLVKALIRAAHWLDENNNANRNEAVEILARPE